MTEQRLHEIADQYTPEEFTVRIYYSDGSSEDFTGEPYENQRAQLKALIYSGLLASNWHGWDHQAMQAIRDTLEFALPQLIPLPGRNHINAYDTLYIPLRKAQEAAEQEAKNPV